jgi:glycosyltransferase involved in cell wall biosynthesis
MKISVISNSASPSKNASSLQTAKLCEAMTNIGHEVSLILPNTGYKKNFFKFYNIKSRFKLLRIKFFKKFPIGINYYFYSLSAIYLSSYKNQDLIITRNFFVSFILCVLKKNHIVEIHDDLNIEGRIIRLLVFLTKFLNSNSIIKLITTTHTLKKVFIKRYGVKKDKIQVLHNASSLNVKFKNYKSLKKKLNIGYFGSIFESRGLKIITKLSEIDRNNNYFIYGGEKNDIKNLKKKFKNTNIFFSQFIPYSNIVDRLKKIDVCILPYTKKITVSGNVGDISSYTSPLKVFDYMKTGKLIICSNLKVIREVLIDNENCLLVDDFENINIWLSTINSIKSNKKRFNRIRQNAYIFGNKYNIIWRAKNLLLNVNKY